MSATWKARAAKDRAAGIDFDPEWYTPDYYAWWDIRRPWCHATASELSWRLRPRSILDVGCGNGLMLESWIAQGLDAYGLDISPHAKAAASPVVRDHITTLDLGRQQWPYADASFDMLSSVEVLEHIRPQDMPHVLREAMRVLRPGGRFFVQTPKPGTAEADDPTHINVLPKKEWVRQFRHAGFRTADDELLAWEHELPMTPLGRSLGRLRLSHILKRHVVRTGTRTLYKKPSAFA